MDDVAKWSQKDRDDLFSETSASKNGLNITIIEKDFWVCWVLKRVFSSPTKELPLIFKGGTSLSKAYSAIERFSEDIDLSINRTFFDFQGDKDPTNIDLSRNKRKKLLDEMAEKLANYLEFKLLPELQTIFTSELGEGGWRLEISKDNKENMLFYYPTTNGPAETDEYIKSVILLEFGTRSDHWPSEMASIRCSSSKAATGLRRKNMHGSRASTKPLKPRPFKRNVETEPLLTPLSTWISLTDWRSSTT